MTRLVSVLAACAAAAMVAFAAPANAAALRYVMVSGGRLHRPVVIDTWTASPTLLPALIGAPKAKKETARTLRARPRLRVTLFWSWVDEERPTRPSQGNQKGWFYPSCRAHRAVVQFTVNGKPDRRYAPKQLLGALKSHHVPTASRTCKR